MNPAMVSVLVVDGHEGSRGALVDLLTLNGYEVRCAAHGGEALMMLSEAALPDVIILDVLLPWVSGTEVLATLRQRAGVRRVPVLVVTGVATSESELREYAPLRLLRKPLNYDAVVPTLQALLVEALFH